MPTSRPHAPHNRLDIRLEFIEGAVHNLHLRFEELVQNKEGASVEAYFVLNVIDG